jgi:hypothetical protein
MAESGLMLLPIRCRRRLIPAPLLLIAIGFLSSPSASALADWADWRVTGPFVCRAEFPLEEVRPLLADLARLQSDLVHMLRVRPASERIEVFLFRNEASYRQYLKRYLPSVPYRRALYVRQGGQGMVLAYKNGGLAVDIRHECTHALLHAALPVVPLWLDEGLAEYFEVPPLERAFDNTHLRGSRWNAMLGIVPKLKKMERIGDISEMGIKEYRDAWAWVHFMLHGADEAHEELIGFLRNIQTRTPPGLMSSRLRRRLPNLEKRFANHFKRWNR